MTDKPDIVQRAEQALDGITPGPWLHADSSHGRSNVISTIGWDVASCSDGGIGKGWPAAVMKIAARNADFIAAAPELVRELLAAVKRLTADLDAVCRLLGYRWTTPEVAPLHTESICTSDLGSACLNELCPHRVCTTCRQKWPCEGSGKR